MIFLMISNIKPHYISYLHSVIFIHHIPFHIPTIFSNMFLFYRKWSIQNKSGLDMYILTIELFFFKWVKSHLTFPFQFFLYPLVI